MADSFVNAAELLRLPGRGAASTRPIPSRLSN